MRANTKIHILKQFTTYPTTDIQEEFTVAKKHYRYDPYDNQYGEVEIEESMVNRQDVKLYRIIHSKKIK